MNKAWAQRWIKLFVDEGASVVAVARRPDTLHNAFAGYAQVQTVATDVAAADAVERIVNTSLSQFGESSAIDRQTVRAE